MGYFLSHGLPNARLATEVFQRSKTLLRPKKGDFCGEVENTGQGRSLQTMVGWYKILSNDYEGDPFTAWKEKIILCEVFDANKNILMECNILAEDW